MWQLWHRRRVVGQARHHWRLLADAHREAAGTHRGTDLARLADDVTVDLDGDRTVGAHPDLLAHLVVEGRMTLALAGGDAGRDGHPADDAARRRDDGVELSVVDARVRHEHETAEEAPAVADDHHAGAAAELELVVDLDGDAELGRHDVLEPRDHVCRPADLGLEVLVGAGHDLRVHPDAGHDEEVVGLGVARLVRSVVHRCRADDELADVDAAVAARQGDRDGRLERDGQVEVAGQQVAGSRGQDAESRLGADERAGDVAHRAVTAEGADDVGAVPYGLRGLPLTGVLHGRLVEERLAPAVREARGSDPRAHPGQVGELRGVDDDAGALERRRRLVFFWKWSWGGRG